MRNNTGQWILTLLTAALISPAPTHGADAAPPPKWVIHAAWIDPYDSRPYSATLDPGMAIIATPNSQMSWTLGSAGKRDTPVNVTGISLRADFARYGGRVLQRPEPSRFVFLLPDTGGTFPITLGLRSVLMTDTEEVTLTVLIPKDFKIYRGRINGYVMGNYAARVDDRRAPEQFVEITPDIMDLHLSRQFRIRDFVSNSRAPDQQHYFPKYAVIRYALIQKVERLVHIIDQHPNFQCKGIRVLSGFRTPDYNRIVPEAAFHSYHQYGLAADIIVDSAPRDGAFDDVNLDKRVTIDDAAILAQACDQLEKRGTLDKGGIGLYEYKHGGKGGKWHSTYHVHVDVRESKATRWGYAFKNGRRYARLIWK